MIGVELFAIFCLSGNPDRCKDVSFQYSGDASAGGITELQCTTVAVKEVAKWIQSHPGFVTRRFGCRKAGQMAKA